MDKIKKLLEPHKLHDKLGDLFEFFEDLIIVFLTILLFALSIIAIYDLGIAVFSSKYSFMDLIPKFLYVFILAELFRLNIVYLKERIIDTSLIIKTTLIAVLREVIVKAPSFKMEDYLGISVILTILTISYYIPKYVFKKDKKFRLGKIRFKKSVRKS